ncbi:MAG: LuxR C-terminal-related transcriptional regulator, partial [Nocardioidaceae bacterium]
QLGDPVGIARIERELGMLHWADGDLSAAGARFVAAERALEGLEQSPEHAELLYAKVINGVRTGDSVLVADLAGQLRRLADDLGSSSLSARAYLAEAAHDFGRTDYTAMAEANVRALAAAEASGDARLVIRANDQLSVTAGAQGDLDALRRYSDASVQAAQRIGARILQGWPMMRIGVADLLAGHWDAALRTTSEVMAMATRFHQTRGSVSAGAIHAWVLTHRGRLAEARGHLDRAHRIAHPSLQADRNVFNIVALADVTLALAEGEPERARHDTARLADLTGGWLPLLAAGMLAEAYVCSGDLDGARRLAAHVRAVRSCSTVLPQAVSDWVDGLACAAGDHPPDAVGPLQASASAYASLGFPFHTARARLASAEATADPRLGVELAGDALRVFETLGAPVQAQQARRLLRGLGAAPSRGRARTDTGSVLSARELEVAQLVAAGLTNAEVATRLFISPRTVTTHLDRIYSRVGLSSRVALTRYLADSGLLDAVDEPAGPDGSAAQNT